MALTLSDVEKIARLSRLALSGDEKKRNLAQLNDIFALIADMQAVDTDGIEPLSHPHEVTQRLRADHVTAQNRREDYQALAPQVADGLYLVPKVIE